MLKLDFRNAFNSVYRDKVLEARLHAVATADLVHTILPATHQSLPVPSCDVALETWSESHSEEPLSGADAVKERNWDGIEVGVAVESCWLRLQMMRKELGC